jgi:hypothetical protein
MTAETLYTADAGGQTFSPRKFSVQFNNGVAQSVDVDTLQDGGCRADHNTGNVTFDGGAGLRYQQTCPCDGGNNCNPQDVGYSIQGNVFKIYIPDSRGIREQILMR